MSPRVPSTAASDRAPTAAGPGWRRGSVGTARVWDEAEREARRGGTEPPPGVAPRRRRRRVRRRAGRTATTAAPAPQASAPPPAALPAPSAAAVPPLPGDLSPEQEALLLRLRSDLPELDRHPGLRPALEALVLRAVRRGDRTGATPDLGVLRRRAMKLLRALRSVRSEVERVSGLEPGDSGLASVHRSVQGLDPGDEQAESKKEMLVEIFQANLELRQQIA